MRSDLLNCCGISYFGINASEAVVFLVDGQLCNDNEADMINVEDGMESLFNILNLMKMVTRSKSCSKITAICLEPDIHQSEKKFETGIPTRWSTKMSFVYHAY